MKSNSITVEIFKNILVVVVVLIILKVSGLIQVCDDVYNEGQVETPDSIKVKTPVSMKVDSSNEENTLRSLDYPETFKETMVKWLMAAQKQFSQETDRMVETKISQDDPRLVQHIRKILLPPSVEPGVRFSRRALRTPQMEEVLNVLGKKRNGVFIEAGAFDGERASNTLYLETKFNWTGLLVEMDPYLFMQVIGRNRRAHSLNACLSGEKYPIQLTIAPNIGSVAGKVSLKKNSGSKRVCYPLYSILMAMNMTKIDYFSLDTEGYELHILKTLPWNKLDISVLSVEWRGARNFGHTKEEYKAFMEDKGYRVHKDISIDVDSFLHVKDYIFVKNDLKIQGMS